MKKFFLFVCIFLFVTTPAFAMKNSPDGFRGIKWGDPVSALGDPADIKFEGQRSGYDIYTRVTDKLSLGDVPLNTIIYTFCNDKLVFVSLSGRYSDLDMLKDIFTERYGSPHQPNVYIKEYEWRDKNALIIFSSNKFAETVSITICSNKQYNLSKQYLREKAKEAQSDF